MEFKSFLEKSRKVNGERYLPKTISLYCDTIKRLGIEGINKDVESLIDHVNSTIKNTRNPYIPSAFKQYLLFLGLDEEDDRLKKIKRSKKRASVLNSQRMLGDKSIPRKDIELLYSKLDDDWKLILNILYSTAIREDEFLNIRWKDITLVDDNKNIGSEIRIKGKGSKFRVVFLSKNTTEVLMNKRKEDDESDKIFVFRKNDGELYKRQEKALIDGFRKRTKDILGKAYSPHSTRHSRLSHLADTTEWDLMSISKFAGHSDFSVTSVYLKGSKNIAKSRYEKNSDELL